MKIDNEFLEIFREINRDAAIEMSYKPRSSYIARCKELNIPFPKHFFDPKIRSIHPWLARRPRSMARFSVLLACNSQKISELFNMNKIHSKVKENYPPLISYTLPTPLKIPITLCDPMAGGGSIPLESVLLGADTIAFDYNPVAYLILKGTIEFPLKFKRKLLNLLKNEIEKLLEFANFKLRKFYNESDDAYIFSKIVECPFCGNQITLDLEKNVVKKKNILSVRCDNCRRKFEKNKNTLIKEWVHEHKTIISKIIGGMKVSKEEIKKVYPILFIKDKNRNYRKPKEEDYLKLVDAANFLSDHTSEFDKFLPKEEILKENKVFSSLLEHDIKYWYEIFNPRQLLSLVLLTIYIRKKSLQLINEYGELGAAVSLYLSFGLSKMVDFNTILTTWNFTNKSIRDTIGQYARSRKIQINLTFSEAVVPFKNLYWVFEPNSSSTTGGGIFPVVNELVKQLENVNVECKILQFDAKRINYLGRKTLDIINVDPPYFDQHIYSDLSEFFWIFLRNSLKDILEKHFFNEEIDGKKSWEFIGWDPKLPFVPRKDELIVKKGNNFQKEVEKYKKNFVEFLRASYDALKDNGKLILWFTHKSWNAWESILYSLFISGFKVEGFYPIVSEHPTRSVSMFGEPKLNRTILIIANKNGKEKEFDKEEVLNFCKKVDLLLQNAKICPHDEIQEWERLLTLMAASSAKLTSFNYKNCQEKNKLFQQVILPQGIVLGIEAYIKIAKNENILNYLSRYLSNHNKCLIFLHVLKKIFGSVSPKLSTLVCKYFNISLVDLRKKNTIDTTKNGFITKVILPQ